MKIDPIGNRLIIRLDEFKEKTAGGIVLPEIVQNNLTEKFHTATVVAVGEGRTVKDSDGNETIIPLEVKPGDRVVYNKFSGTSLKDEYEGCIILESEHILAILEEV